MHLEDVKKVLSNISFARSCVDMGWEWEAKVVNEVGPRGYGFVISGFALRCSFQRPDRLTGKITRGFGRWWLVPADVTSSGIVKTAFAAAKLIVEHEIMEAFHYMEVRVFDPHHELSDLFVAASNKSARLARAQ